MTAKRSTIPPDLYESIFLGNGNRVERERRNLSGCASVPPKDEASSKVRWWDAICLVAGFRKHRSILRHCASSA